MTVGLRLKKGWLKGLEPSTSGTTIQRSNQLSYSHHRFCSAEPRNPDSTSRRPRWGRTRRTGGVSAKQIRLPQTPTPTSPRAVRATVEIGVLWVADGRRNSPFPAITGESVDSSPSGAAVLHGLSGGVSVGSEFVSAGSSRSTGQACASNRAVTVVEIPPRAVKAATNSTLRGATTATKSSRIRFVTFS